MSSEEILRNIYSYLEVLEVAHSEKVNQWTDQSLQNATRWAEYCEQIFLQSKGKPYAVDLDRHIQKFNLRPWSLGGDFIHLGFLEKASQHIRNVLLQNPYLSSRLYGLVMESCINSCGKDHFIQVCANLSRAKATLEIARVIEASLRPASDSPCSSNKEKEQEETAEAVLLHRYLQHTLKHSVRDHRTENVIEGKLRTMGATPTGLTVLLRCLKHVNEIRHQQSEEITVLLVRHIVNLMDGDTENKSTRCLPPDLLTWCAATYTAIFTSFMRRLAVEAEKLSAEFDPCSLRVNWKRTCEEGMSYDSLVKRLKELRRVSEDLANSVDGTLARLSETNDHEVWRCLIRDVNK